MFSYLKIAFKSFLKFRKKRKSLTLVLSGAFFLIFFLISLFTTLFTNIEDYWGKMLLGNGEIVTKSYKDYKAFNPPKKGYYFSFDKIKSKLNKIDGINFSERLRIGALIEGYKSRQRTPLVLIGMQSEKERKIIPNVELSDGRFPRDSTKEICLYFNSAGRLDVDVGDTVIIYTTNVNGYMDYDLLTVSGIIEPRKTQYFVGSDVIGYIPLSFAESIKAVNKNIVSEVAFSSESSIKIAELNYLIPDKFKVVSMLDSEEIPLTLKWIYGFLLWVLIILIIGVVFSSIYHNVNLMIIQRYRELGVYLSFGASKWWILKIWLGEFTFYIIYCSIIGAILSTLIIYGINNMGLYAPSAAVEVALSSSVFLIFIKLKYYVLSFLILWLVVLFAAISPILKGINEDIIVKLFKR